MSIGEHRRRTFSWELSTVERQKKKKFKREQTKSYEMGTNKPKKKNLLSSKEKKKITKNNE